MKAFIIATLLFFYFLTNAQNQCPVWEWAKPLSASASTHIEPAYQGHSFIAGLLAGPINFGSTSIAPDPSNNFDSYIALIDSLGNGQWAKRIDNFQISSVLSTPQNHLYVTGIVEDTLLLGSDTLIPVPRSGLALSFTSAIIHFDSTGSLLWTRTVDSASFNYLSADATGNLFISGGTKSTKFGSILTDSNVTQTMPSSFIAKISNQGQWSFVQSPDNVTIGQIAAASNGNTWVAINASNTINLTGVIIPSGSYIALIDSNGSWQWITVNTWGGNLSHDKNGNCLIFGRLNGVSKIDQQGQQVWNSNQPGLNLMSSTIRSLDADQFGNGYITSFSTQGGQVFGQDTLEAGSLYVAKISASGQWEWAGMTRCSNCAWRDISVQKPNQVVLSGQANSDFLIGPFTPRANLGVGDFLAKISTEPSLSFPSYSDTIHCGDSLTLQIPTNSAAYLHHTWSPSTGMTDSTSAFPIVSPTTTTTYYVHASRPGGCGDSAQVTVYVNPHIDGIGMTNFVPSTGNLYYCDNNYSINIPTPGLTNFQWSNGDTTSALHPKGPGSYSVTYLNDRGCQVTDSLKIYSISEIKTAAGLALVCASDTQTLYSSSPVDSVYWSNGISSDSITVTTAGTYWMTAWKDGCSFTDTMKVDLFTDTANAEFNYQISGDTVRFTPTSAGLVKAQWYFGDGWNDNVISPTHIYARKDTFEVCLEILDLCGYRDTVCKTINLNDVSLEEPKHLTGVKVFPNPVKDKLNIGFENSTPAGSTHLDIDIIDLSGKRIRHFEVSYSEEIEINTSELPSGTYILRVNNFRYRFIKS